MPEGGSPVTQEQARVLVVDDSSVIRLAIRKMLQTDFDVVMAEDGEAGWALLLNDNRIKVLITDIEMPGLDGYGFICRARAADEVRIRDLPIIAITGAEDEDTKARAYACGATDFITKPLDRLQLQARVQAYVQFNEKKSALTEQNEALQEELVDDPLTHLRSRRYFLQRGEQDLSFALRHQQPLSLIRLDIDGFKKLYQEYGDDAADHVLVWLANIVAATARTEDTVARVGGAEFAMLAPNTDRAAALVLCERVRKAVSAAPLAFQDKVLTVTVSLGLVTLGVDHRNSIEELLALAERRLQHAKSDGGNRASVSVFGEAIPEPEVVTLSAPEELPASAPEIASRAATIAQKAADYRQQQPAAASPLLFDLISIDRALQILARGDGAALAPYLPSLIMQMLPLLELYAADADPEQHACLNALKAKLAL